MQERLFTAKSDYITGVGDRFIITITMHKGAYVTKLIDLESVTVLCTNENIGGEYNASRMFYHIQNFIGYHDKRINTWITDAVYAFINTNPDLIIECELRRQCCNHYDGYLFFSNRELRCISCHASQGARGLWELGLTDKRPSLSKKRRERIRKRDGDICPECGTTITESNIDHKISINDGTKNSNANRIFINSDQNLRHICAKCNRKKGTRSDKSL